MASQEVLTALETLHKELEKLEPAIKHVELAQEVTQTVRGIPIKHLELLKKVTDLDSILKDELKNLFEKELYDITRECGRLQKYTAEIQRQVKTELGELERLREMSVSLHTQISKINFPERLDRMDANIAGIVVAIQNIQGRLDMVERNLGDRIINSFENQKRCIQVIGSELNQTKNILQASMEKILKKQKTFTYITWALIIIGVLVIVLLKVK